MCIINPQLPYEEKGRTEQWDLLHSYVKIYYNGKFKYFYSKNLHFLLGNKFWWTRVRITIGNIYCSVIIRRSAKHITFFISCIPQTHILKKAYAHLQMCKLGHKEGKENLSSDSMKCLGPTLLPTSLYMSIIFRHWKVFTYITFFQRLLMECKLLSRQNR